MLEISNKQKVDYYYALVNKARSKARKIPGRITIPVMASPRPFRRGFLSILTRAIRPKTRARGYIKKVSPHMKLAMAKGSYFASGSAGDFASCSNVGGLISPRVFILAVFSKAIRSLMVAFNVFGLFSTVSNTPALRTDIGLVFSW
jgi:hypothetical protein